MARTEARLDATGAVTRRRSAGPPRIKGWEPVEPRTDWARVDATTEADIERQAAFDDAEGDQNYSVKGDRSLSSGDEDKLGFREVAKRIATALVDHASEDGLAIGIEGTWGSGKSSLLFLIADELGKLPRDREPTIIDFRPWLIGNRDALITSLFGELSRQLDQVALDAGDATRISVAKAKEAGEALRRFISALSKTGSAIEVAGDASGIGPVKWFGKAVKAVGEFVGKKPAARELSELKDKLVKSLRDLEHRFVVTIDDVDRLDPAEVIEVLRLVRSVVDLPNVIYLLCYDSDTLAHSIEQAASVKSGQSYLEKIVQLTVMVPKPEPLQLRQWFSDELHLIASPKDEDELSRLKLVIDYEGGRQLRTPRSVVRALDAVRFFWPPLREAKADLADLVWLQLIKNGNPALYRWIEEYCGTAAALSLGTARVEDAEKARELAELLKTVARGHFDDLIFRHNFAEQLPGVELDHSQNGNTFKIFERVSDRHRDEAIRTRRLASPDHYRLYFALAGPSHALTQDDFASMWAAAEAGADEAGMALLHLHDEHAAGSLTKADLLLERIKSGAYEVLAPGQCENLLIALSQVMDEAYRHHPFDRFWVNSLWDRAEGLIPLLLRRLEPPRRAAVVTAMFSEGEAIGWLTSLFRHETGAHGRYGDRQRAEDEWLFTNAELDRITELMLGRYRAMSASDVFGCPDPISLLFAWRQGGDEHGPRRLFEANIVSDEGLVETLEHLTTAIYSRDRGKVDVLKRENLAPFMDYEKVTQTIHALKNHNDLGARARRLAVAFDNGNAH
ncbi:MAG TPA: P-loop NTPase fold protein [Stellaceae bacterium]|nr:P-loop NTPase fold protein [Stellaceae bacterium]